MSVDPVFASTLQELDRQQNQIELIASENIVSEAVLAAQGSVLTNKYAEGWVVSRGCSAARIAAASVPRSCTA